jgi:hypothetical protein
MTDMEAIVQECSLMIESLEVDLTSLSAERDATDDPNIKRILADQIRDRKRLIEWIDQVVMSARAATRTEERMARRRSANAERER